VTADELVGYVKREVKNYAKQRGRQQTPLEFGDFPDDMILGFSPVARENWLRISRNSAMEAWS